jgi:lysophospholipase L1-like esterase
MLSAASQLQQAIPGIRIDAVKRYPNAVMVDWHAASANRPELLWTDGIHLRPEGAQFYANLIAALVKAP